MKGLLTSILTVLTFTGLQAQPLPSTPKLVVGLTIDQLRTDYLEAFSTLYGDRGFRRLWKEGRVFRNILSAARTAHQPEPLFIQAPLLRSTALSANDGWMYRHCAL